MADKDLHWIRDWDIISAAAIFGFISSFSPYLQLPRLRNALDRTFT